MDRVFSTNENRNACRILMRKPKAKRPLGRRKCRRVVNFKMSFGEI
jgi:hypothetical protein